MKSNRTPRVGKLVFCTRFKHYRTGKYVYPKRSKYFAFIVKR